MRLIDADKLKENIEYALLQHEDTEKWLKWFNQVIDAEPTVLEQIRDEIERLHYHPKLDFIKNDEVVE